jgi:hypothetical protein
LHEDQEGRLEGIFSGVVVVKHATTHAEHHGAVPVDQGAESGLSRFLPRYKERHDLVIREPDHRPAVEEVFNLVRGCAVNSQRHQAFSRQLISD